MINKIRALGSWYTKGLEQGSHLRTAINSTDSLASRMAQLRALKVETSMWNSDFGDLGKQILLNSHDPIYDAMEALHTFKSEAGLWNSEYKELGTQLLLNSFDRREERLLAAEHFRVEASLWQSELQDIQKQIYDDQYWEPGSLSSLLSA